MPNPLGNDHESRHHVDVDLAVDACRSSLIINATSVRTKGGILAF